jgi:uncharacterized protein (TIGR02266 family)
LAEHFRRIDPRYDRELSVDVSFDGQSQTGRSLNISLGGMFVECVRTLPIGAAVALRFKVPTQPEPIEVTGDVRWIVPPGPSSEQVGIGVRFQGLRARDVWALNRFFLT